MVPACSRFYPQVEGPSSYMLRLGGPPKGDQKVWKVGTARFPRLGLVSFPKVRKVLTALLFLTLEGPFCCKCPKIVARWNGSFVHRLRWFLQVFTSRKASQTLGTTLSNQATSNIRHPGPSGTLLVAPNITTSSKNLLVTKGTATRSKDTTSSSWHYY